MPIYKPSRKDVKYYVEDGMKKLGWKVNSNIQEKYATKECAVIYSDLDNKLDTTQSYWDKMWIKIIFDLNDNADFPYVTTEILSFITKHVEESGAPSCTSFYFGNCTSFPAGTTYRIEMSAVYQFEVDWVPDEI